MASTLRSLDAHALDDLVANLSDGDRRVYVLSGDASMGVAQQMLGELRALRHDVHAIDGNDVAVRRTISQLHDGDVVIAIDLRRYDRWVVEAVMAARDRGAWIAAVTDSLLSPLAASADRTFTVAAASGGPFDSHVGTLALANVVVAGVADRLRADAIERLDRAEAAWREGGALTDR